MTRDDVPEDIEARDLDEEEDELVEALWDAEPTTPYDPSEEASYFRDDWAEDAA